MVPGTISRRVAGLLLLSCARPTNRFQFSIPLFEGVAEAALYCAHRTSTVLSCAFCEQEGHLAAPSPSLQARSLPLQGWGLIDLLLRASNEGSLRPRVARAQKIIRLHPLRFLFFVLMNVDDLSCVIDFDRDLRADSDIPEHAALGS